MNWQSWLQEHSQKLMNAVRATILMLVGFQVVTITTEQLALLIASLESVFAVITAKTTVPEHRIDTIVAGRVSDILTPPPKG